MKYFYKKIAQKTNKQYTFYKIFYKNIFFWKKDYVKNMYYFLLNINIFETNINWKIYLLSNTLMKMSKN